VKSAARFVVSHPGRKDKDAARVGHPAIGKKLGEIEPMSYYVLKNKHSIPHFMFLLAASWVIVLAGVSIVLLADWSISATMHFSAIESLHGPLRLLLNLCGAYAGIGAICLYVTMWVYWIAVERGSVLARIGWLLALLFTLHYGALIYALVVWRRDVVKVQGPQPLHDSLVGGSKIT
jgi:hypothetical protein